MWRPHDQPILPAAVKTIEEDDDNDLSTSGTTKRDQQSNNSRAMKNFG